jgi:sulfate permease, SulP family
MPATGAIARTATNVKSGGRTPVAGIVHAVFVDLTVALSVGMVLAAFLFMTRMSEVSNISLVTRDLQDAAEGGADDSGAIYRRQIPPGVEVYEINGPFFFGAAEKFKDTLAEVSRKPKVLVIRLRHLLAMDSTAMHALRDLVRKTKQDGTTVIFAALERPRPES